MSEVSGLWADPEASARPCLSVRPAPWGDRTQVEGDLGILGAGAPSAQTPCLAVGRAPCTWAEEALVP